MENLISLFSALSEQFLINDGACSDIVCSKQDKLKNIKLVRQKAFDVVHQCRQNESEESIEWYPEILLTDYAYELLQKGAEGSSNLLFTSIGDLEESEFDFDEILTFLLRLKGPFVEEARQHPFSLSGCDYFLRPANNPFQLLPEELTCGVVDDTPTSPESASKGLFLENFIDVPKKRTVVRNFPKLEDLIENDVKTTPKKEEIKKEEPEVSRPISPWSDFERDILDGADFTKEIEAGSKKSFAEDYKAKLNGPIRDPFATKPKNKRSKAQKGLALSIYLEEEHLKSVLEPAFEKIAYQEINLQDYVDQVKYLLLGIDTRIFKYDAIEKKFFMKCGVFLAGIPPDCLFELSRNFLECGTFFKNLSYAVDDGIASNSGVIYPAFWSSVSNFLERHCNAVANLPPQGSLMLLKMSTSNMCSALAAVNRLCFPKNGSLPSDGHLISYLFESCVFLHCKSVVFAIIYDCCVVYFSKLLEKWMFQGFLDVNCCADFFIMENNQMTSIRERSLYCSLRINEKSVPPVLFNLVSRIFSCGRALWLLKMCDPENDFIIFSETRKTPKLRICFSDQDFSNMEQDFKIYEKTISELGKITISEVFEKSPKKSPIKTSENPEPEENPEEMIIEEEKKLTKDFYNKVARETENVKKISEWRTKRLELDDKRAEFLKQDLINENTVLDEEGNVIAPTEADMENANIVSDKNFNNSPQKMDNEALRNKSKIMGTTNQEEYQKKMSTEAMKNKLKIMGTEYGLEDEPKIKNVNSMTEAMKNKMKILGTEYGTPEPISKKIDQPITEAMKNKLKILGTEYGNEETVSKKVNQPLTAAMENKLKIMGTEYNQPEIKEILKGELTENMKNRNKIMGTDIGKPMTEIEKCQKMTDAKRNKLKMMSSEFDIKLPEKPETEPEKPKNSLNETPELQEESTENRINIFESKAEKPSLLELSENFETPNFDNMDITTFSRCIQRSLLIALNVQERLANSSVLKHFLNNENFLTHITSLRCFYLLHDGEFSRSLTYGLFQSLIDSSDPLQFFDPSSLSSILNEALNSAYHSSQINAQNVSFQILKIPKKLDKESHDVLSPFQLSYKVNWPINIIITGKIIERYRQVFHVLVNLKRVHWMLNETFLLLKSQTKDQILDGKLLMKSPEYTKIATYRHAMTLFIMTLEEHLSTNGLQVAWNNFMKNLETVNDLDHLYQKHVEFVKDVCRRCFLSRSSLLMSYINELVELGLNFHLILKSSTWRLINDKQYSHPKYSELKALFNKFCRATKLFTKALRKKSQNEEMAIHTPLLELINLKIKF